jgi:hypothetical protein
MNRRGDPLDVPYRGIDCTPPTGAMTIENGTAIVIVLAYMFVSIGVIIAFLLAVFVIEWFIGRLRQRRGGYRGKE